ncbi:MAG: Na+/H+ antiporter NhaA [Gammaproteobacteria bacterium]
MIQHVQNGMFQRFLHSQVAGSLVLLVSTCIALGWANSQWGQLYYDISHTYVGVSFGEARFQLTLSHWIKDGLMAIFFFVVGLEIKREIVVGELSSLDKALLPVGAALGGAVVPALLYVWVNVGGPGAAGWGIPMATDIAFALGVLSLFGRRVPISLKVFLTALAIADDLLAVFVIAVFYTPQLNVYTLLFSAVPLALMVLANRSGIRATWVYTVLALAVWVDVLGSGVHATIAGILVALVIPVRPAIEPREFVRLSSAALNDLRKADQSLEALIHDKERRDQIARIALLVEDAIPAGIALESRLHPVQSFLILPLFALFSAGVAFSPENLQGFPTPVSLGVMVGLIVGKPIGVVIAGWLIIRVFGNEEIGISLGQLLGAGCLAGIGFTMSIFISELAFVNEALIDQAKVGILAGSLFSGILGAAILSITLPKTTAQQ